MAQDKIPMDTLFLYCIYVLFYIYYHSPDRLIECISLLTSKGIEAKESKMTFKAHRSSLGSAQPEPTSPTQGTPGSPLVPTWPP